MKKVIVGVAKWFGQQIVDVLEALTAATKVALCVLIVGSAVVVFLNYIAVFLTRWSI